MGSNGLNSDPIYDEGYEAFFEGGCDCVPPYPEGSDGELGFIQGWKTAEKEFELQTGDSHET